MGGNRANESNTTDSVYYEFLQQLSFGILIFEFGDRDDGRSLKIAEANPKAAHFIGVRTEALRGAPLDDIPQFKGTNLTERFLPVLQNGNSVDLGDVSLPSSEKQSVVYRARAFPLSANRVGLTLEETTPQKVAEQTIHKSEDHFYPLIHGVKDYAIFMLDPKGNVLSWNEGATRLNGYLSEEIIGKKYSTFFTPEDKKSGKPEALLREAAEKGQAEDEGWRLRKDGSTYWANALVTALHDEEGDLYGFAKITRDMTERKEREESVRMAKEQLEVRGRERTAELVHLNELLKSEVYERRHAEEQLRALAARLQRVREDERTHVAREIHDALGQMCTALKMDIAWISQRLPKEQRRLREKSESAMKLVGELIQSLRRLSSELRPSTLDGLGLVAAIEWQGQEFQTHTGIRCELYLPTNELTLDKERSTAIFRIFQETLTNVARHANAKVVQTNLVVGEGEVVLVTHDNGKGFDLPAAERRGSLGLLGMKERVHLLGGEFKIASAPGKGTTVIVHLPLRSPS